MSLRQDLEERVMAGTLREIYARGNENHVSLLNFLLNKKIGQTYRALQTNTSVTKLTLPFPLDQKQKEDLVNIIRTIPEQTELSHEPFNDGN